MSSDDGRGLRCWRAPRPRRMLSADPIYYQHAYLLGESEQEPQPVADYIMDRNGHILPYVRFSGGKLTLRGEALEVLRAAAAGSPRGRDG